MIRCKGPLQRKNVIVLLFLSFQTFSFEIEFNEKEKYCSTLECGRVSNSVVCGIREEREGFRLRLFKNECELLKHGCNVTDKLTYGIINKEYCLRSFNNTNDKENLNVLDSCEEINCFYFNDTQKVCGLRQDGAGFRIKLFFNKCHLLKHNCENTLNFTETDMYVCNELTVSEFKVNQNQGSGQNKWSDKPRSTNVVVIDGSLINFKGNVNETVENFFEATHYLNIPLYEMNNISLGEDTRRNMFVKYAGPVKVFQPWITVPKNKSKYYEDLDFRPTIASCYHKCPKKCPDLYAPVCGVPGIAAREPSLMFQNHCYMDVAQCKMKRENKSSTSDSSDYIESSFVFCLGDTMNVMYRFLPLVRTLQHMGRLKKKGYFKYKLRNMRFLNNLLVRQQNIMG